MFFAFQVDDAVIGHGLERARQVARFAPSGLSQCRDHQGRFGHDVQQGPVIITEHFLANDFMEVNQILGSLALLVVPACNSQDTLADFFLRHDTDHNRFHGFLTSSRTLSTSAKIVDQLLCILEFIRHTLVRDMAVLMVIRQDAASVLELLGRFDRMCVVITQNALPIRLVQCQRIPNAMRDFVSHLDLPRFQLEPVVAALVKD